MNLEVDRRKSPLECAGASQSVEAYRSVFLASVKFLAYRESLGFHFWCMFKGGNVTNTKVTREAESFLFERSRDCYSAIGPSHPSRGGL
ncbi:hypothetical protein TNCV_164121 [Trichonephila clavipes]|nr:hypothetical protein TNCV_164121 [Trichonephila clavipes]